ncbi:sulfotransferase [Moorena producens JHB]|uniref:Sulfotransferase n=1 Tax=Moorena producens (strain JHB) TaxID=1454205 RepID=A0A9Q9STK1_MOOP1|nr:sulfotransferase [Moorena producens]WAN69404.1 sulfotransferase [Moorena producens JHB]
MKDSSFLDFVVIGARKTGTTSLDNYLDQHPELSVP